MSIDIYDHYDHLWKSCFMVLVSVSYNNPATKKSPKTLATFQNTLATT